MSRVHLCAECVSQGIKPDPSDVTSTAGGSDAFLIACAFCGAVDEQATHARNIVDIHDEFGALMEDGGARSVQFREEAERKHAEFIDKLLHVYLSDPVSRVVDRPGDHFKAGVRTWYNRYRQHEARRGGVAKKAATRNESVKVKYLVAVAVYVTILESNIVLINNRLAHLGHLSASSRVPAARGDGCIMPPSFPLFIAKARALGPNYIGYLSSLSLLRSTYARFKTLRGVAPSALEITLSQVYTLSQHIQFLCRLPPHVRVEHLVATDLKPAAKRKARACADPDDFVLGNAEWEYMSKVDWSRTLDIAYHLYCVQQVVSLWGNRCSIDISVALLQWAIMATTGNTMPLTVWSTELAVRYRGSEVITARRREEMKDILIGWSTSFPETGLPVPILPAPKRGTMGNGITGYGSDKRRPIPENVMAIAAAPVIAENWRHIMDVRLQTRTRALPLDEEFTMAARMFADAYSEHFKATKNRQLATRLKAKQDAKDDKLATKVAKREAEAAAKSAKSAAREARRVAKSAPGSRRGSRPPSQPVDPAGRSKSQPLDPKEPQSSVNLETLLATMEDSSDDDAGNDSEDDGDMPSSSRPLDIENLGAGEAAVPFGFSIGPDGFSVATSDSKPATTVSVGPPLTQSLRAQQKRPFSQMSAISEAASSKRRKVRQRPAAPPSPPSTGGSTPAGRSPSPSPSLASIRSLRLVSPTPSLRAVSMSPSLSSMPLQPVDGLPNTAHIGRLIRERQQYAYYNAYNDQRSGKIVSPEVERAMNAWVATKKAEGVVPEKITRQYLADQLDFHGDPKTDDLGPFIQAHPQWSPTECLLRLGVRPIEFPTHHVPHSLLDLEQQLGHFKWSDRLGPEDEPLSTAELDRELDTLFSLGDESWRGLLATPAEAARREKAYLKSGAWSYGRDIPEGSRRRLDQGKGKSDGKARNRESVLGGKMSKRINYGALERLVAQPVAGSDVGDNDEDEEADDEVIGELVHETLWDALGTATSRVEDDGDDDGDDGENDDEGEDDDDNDNDNNDIDQ